MSRERDEAPIAEHSVHLLVGDLSRTACHLPAMPGLPATTEADHATCRECILNSGRFSSQR